MLIPRVKSRALIRTLFTGGLLCGLAIWLLLHFSQQIVSLPSFSHQPGDVIVVLGGEPNNRPKLAAQLFLSGCAPKIIVSGRGDDQISAVNLLGGGVPTYAILIENNSATTYENARNTAPLLDAMHAQHVILVTSWFHARRARACFQYFRPNMEFVVASTSRESEYLYSKDQWAWRELLKTGFYWVRYGISPF